MSRLRAAGYLLATVAIFAFAVLSACSMTAPDDPANDAAAVDALNAWWKEETYHPPPVKAGGVNPAFTFTYQDRVHSVPRHIQTKKEAEDEAEDARYLDHKRSIVRGFNVKGDTVTVMTNLTGNSVDTEDAQGLCHELGGFVWASDNRHFGLQNINVTGASGELLSYRVGLTGTFK